ncbi:MAG: 2-phospho-L-lactate transferase [Burkholderiales bacterium]|nr:2-phospho-L-lactate transferase [Burkholderiales bacterium]
MILVLAGGVGGARLAMGLARVLSPGKAAFVVNTGDDFEHLGLTICPDLDTVLYTLAGVHNPATGWGRRDETWSALDTLAELGGETWFRLGDRDLALHLLRTQALRARAPLSLVTRMLARRLGVRHAILPMSDTPVRTRVLTDRGELAFQDYFVRLRCRPRVRGFRFAGIARAQIPARLAALLASPRLRAVVIAPSNPYVSVAPILRVPAIKRWFACRRVPVIAVSPIVGGAALKGPAAKMMRELGAQASALGVARHYRTTVDGWVIDRADATCAPRIAALGHAVCVTDTVMSDARKSEHLAGEIIRFVHLLSRGRASF